MPNPKIKHVQVDENTLADIDLPSTATPSITSLTTSGDAFIGGKVVTGRIQAPSDGANDTVLIPSRLAVGSTSNFTGDIFVGGWEQYTPQWAVSPTWRPTESQDSLRLNGTFIVNGEIDTLGHTLHAGDMDCDSLDISGTLDCSSGFNSYGYSYISGELSVNNQMTVSGNLNANSNVTISNSLTVGGTLRANGDLKTNSVYPSETNKKSVGKSNYLYRHSYITEMHTDKITSLTNTETYTDPTTGEPATRNVFVTLPTSSGTILTNNDIGTAASKAFTTSVTSGSSDLVTSGAVFTAIDNLPEPMVFKGTLGTGGTITSLPTAATTNEGFTYKVITAGTYASQAAKVGDIFVSNGSAWVIIPAGDTDSDTWRTIKVNGTQLLGSAISTGAVNLKNGSNVTITGSGNDITISATDTTYSDVTTSAHGLMTAADKTKLNSIASGAEVNVQSDWNVTDTTSDAFIKNKPEIPTVIDVTNGVNEAIKNKIIANNAILLKYNNWIYYPKYGSSNNNMLSYTRFDEYEEYELDINWNSYTISGVDKVSQLVRVNESPNNSNDYVNVGNYCQVYEDGDRLFVSSDEYSGDIDAEYGAYGIKLTQAVGINLKFPFTKADGTYTFAMIEDLTDTNQTIKGAGTTFNANAAVDIIAGNNISLTPDSTNNTITIASTDTNQTIRADGYSFGANTAVDIVAGNNVYVVPDVSNHKITIAAKDTTYSSKTAASGGTDVSLVTTGEKYIWNNKSDFSGSYNDLTDRPITKYISLKPKKAYIKDWITKTWGSLTSLSSTYIWTDGNNIYYSSSNSQYVLNRTTSTWETKTWNGLTSFNGSYVWSDGNNIYYSRLSTQYVLNKSTSTWSTKTWSGLTSFDGNSIWTDGENIYYSSGSNQYVLNKSTSTWSAKTWSGLTNFSGGNIWSDGNNIYYSNASTQYVLNKTTSVWEIKTWSGLTSIYATQIWTDNNDIYYSYGIDQYILNKSTFTWTIKTWSGFNNLNDFYGSGVWTDGENIYYSYNLDQYVLTRTHSNVYPLNADYLPLTGGTMTGSINMKGTDLNLKTANSSSNDSGDITFWYGNGGEKGRIWTDDTFTSSTKHKGPNWRVFDTASNQLISTNILLADKSEIVDSLGLGNSASSASWGNVTSANGYTQLLVTNQPNGGGIVFGEKNGQTSLQIDGYYFGNEGQKRAAWLDEAIERQREGEGAPIVRITEAGNWSNEYMILSQSTRDIRGSDNFGHIRVHGVIGGWGGKRQIDVVFDTRDGSYYYSSLQCGNYSSNGSVEIQLAGQYWDDDGDSEGYSGKAFVVMKLNGWGSYDLYIEGVSEIPMPYGTDHFTMSQVQQKISSYYSTNGDIVAATTNTYRQASQLSLY